MHTVLALEPDPRQAGALRLVVRDKVGANLVHVESKDAALEAIRTRVPDLILLTALISPRDESEIADLIRDLEGAEHTQTLTIPLLDTGSARPAKKKKRGLLSALTGGDEAPSGPAGCDPAVFAEEIANYLQQAEQARADAALARERRGKKATKGRKKKDAEPVLPADPVSGSSSYWSWDSSTPSQPEVSDEPAVVEPLAALELPVLAAAEAALDPVPAATDAPAADATEAESTWANPWDVSSQPVGEAAPRGETYLDDIIIPAPDPPLAEPAQSIDALLAQPAPTTAADTLAEHVRAGFDSVRAGLLPRASEPTVISEFSAGHADTPAEPSAALAAFEAAAPPSTQLPEPQRDDARTVFSHSEDVRAELPHSEDAGVALTHSEDVRAGLQPRVPDTPDSDEPVDDDAPAKRGRRRTDDFESDFVPAKLPTRAESGALLALQADLARLRQQRESTGTVLGTAKAAQERAAKAAAEAVERARREADLRAEQAAARAREEAQAERRAREAAEQRAREEAERRAEAERKSQEKAERLAREAAEKARDEAARLARVEHERRLDEERRAREDAERRAAAEREARELSERRAKEEAARLEREARERQAHAEAERKAREAAEAHAAAERKAREEAERRAKQEAERVAKEVERKAKAEVERLAREAEARAREEAQRLEREAERRAREDAERVAREAERKAAEHAERAVQEAERRARAETERLARVKAEEISREKEERARAEARAERLAREEAEKRADAERKARLELERRAEADRKAREEAERKARDEREEAERAAEAARTSPRRKVAKKGRKPAHAAKPAKKKDSGPKAVQDEWGLYNPDAAGFEALFAKLEAIENGEEERPVPDRPRPRPLAMWAVQAEPPTELLHPRRRPDEFRTLVSQFSIPHAVAAVSYASGAKVRKVSVKAVPRPKARSSGDGKVVILSRKLLKAARREAEAADRLTRAS